MDTDNKLALLLNEACNISIAGELQLPILSGNYDSRYIESGEVYDQAIIINVSINELSAKDYIKKLSIKTLECLKSMRSNFDLETKSNNKKRLLRDSLKTIETGLLHLKSKSPYIKINNIEELKKMRGVRYKEIQKKYFNHIVERVVDTSLMFLKEEILEELSGNGINTNHTLRPPLKSKQREPTEFNDMFYSAKNVELSIDILRNLSPPSVDSEYNYIGNNKGIISLWIKCLRDSSVIVNQPARVYATLLNNKFNNLHLGGSEFTHHYKTALEKEEEIQSKISKFTQLGRLGK